MQAAETAFTGEWTRRTPQFWVILLLLVLAGAFIAMRGNVDRVPPSRPLNQLPDTIEGLTGTDLPISASVLEVLGKGVFLNRTYHLGDSNRVAPIGLFIGYFPTQRSGQSIHSPQNCLPGSGWTFESSGTTELIDPQGKPATVGEYIISNGVYRQEVLYWYQTQGKAIANDYAAKAQMLVNSILYSRTDAALVRVTTPVLNGETTAQAHARAVRFTEQVYPMLPAFIPN